MGLFDDLHGTRGGGDSKLSIISEKAGRPGDRLQGKEKTGKRSGEKSRPGSSAKNPGGVRSGKQKNIESAGKESARKTAGKGARASKNDQPGKISATKEKHRIKGNNALQGSISAGAGMIDRASVDILPAAVNQPLTMDDVKNSLPGWLDEWQVLRGVDDIRKVSPLVFRDCCRYIGLTYIKPSRILKDNTLIDGAGRGASACNRYNPAAVAVIYDVFLLFCDMCDKIPFISTFCAFSSISEDYIQDNNEKLTSFGFGFRKKALHKEYETIRQKTSNDPVGRLAILNNEYYSGGVSDSSDQMQTGKLLPVEHTFGLIDVKPIT